MSNKAENPRRVRIALIPGESYQIDPPAPKHRRPNVIYLTRFGRLLEVYTNGTALLEIHATGCKTLVAIARLRRY